MITYLKIDNFKSLIDFELQCTPVTCLIGLNNSGKSTILQAFDFLTALAKGNVNDWLKLRNWKISDLQSNLNQNKSALINYELTFRLGSKSYTWMGSFNTNLRRCTRELIFPGTEDLRSDYLIRVKSGGYYLTTGTKRMIDFTYTGSIISTLKEQLLSPELKEVRFFLQSLKSLDMLNPIYLRKRARSTDNDLGLGGERLSAFLHSLPNGKKNRILQQMQDLFESFNNYNIKAKRSGWKELWISETQQDMPFGFSTEARHISDGFLRILAFFSQFQTDHPVLLFDEIEDGLNPEVMEYLVDKMVEAKQQTIFTTHSPMILNYFEDDVALASVILVYRKSNLGQTHTCKFFDIAHIREKLEYMGPGEVFANINLRELP